MGAHYTGSKSISRWNYQRYQSRGRYNNRKGEWNSDRGCSKSKNGQPNFTALIIKIIEMISKTFLHLQMTNHL